jgi:hypothetical protein
MLSIGVVQVDGDVGVGLAAAARRHPAISLRSVPPDEDPPSGVDAFIVEAPAAKRTEVVQRFNGLGPILTESPITADVERVVSVNPLRYALHTRRLVEEIRRSEELLETIFIAYRFHRTAAQLVHALDYMQVLQPGEVQHVAALQRDNPMLILANLRYSSGTLASLELGNHLPAEFPAADELVVECFSRSARITAHQATSPSI